MCFDHLFIPMKFCSESKNAPGYFTGSTIKTGPRYITAVITRSSMSHPKLLMAAPILLLALKAFVLFPINMLR